MPKSEAAPQQRRDHAVSPMVAIDTVIGTTISGNGVGAATSSSSVPCRRSCCTTLLRRGADRGPDAHDAGADGGVEQAAVVAVCRYMRNTMVAKNSG